MTDGTIFSDPWAQPSAPAPEILRNGRYWLPPVGDPTGKPVSRQRVTNFVKAVSDTYALDQWKQRRVVTGLARREDLYDLARGTAPDDKSTLMSIVDQALEAAKVYEEGGADTGTAFHAYTDQVDRGQPHTARAKWAPKLANYEAAMRAHRLTVIPELMERRVVIERFNVAGTFDRVLGDGGMGELLIGDLKSQKSFYTWWEIALQLALYSEADAMWNPHTLSYEQMPRVSRDLAVVAWMPVTHPGEDRDAVTFYDVDIAEARPALDLVASVLEMRKAGTKWGRPRPLPDIAEQAAPMSSEERYARWFRDASSTHDVEIIAAEVSSRGAFSDLLRAIAATRWEELRDDESARAVMAEMDALHRAAGSPPMVDLVGNPVLPATRVIAQDYRGGPVMARIAPTDGTTRMYDGSLQVFQLGEWMDLPPSQQPVQAGRYDAGAFGPEPVTPHVAQGSTATVIAGNPSMAHVAEALANVPLPPADNRQNGAYLGGMPTAGAVVTREMLGLPPAPVVPSHTHVTTSDGTTLYHETGRNETMRTPETWSRLKNLRVLDPDGWRRAIPGFGGHDWHEPITELEFDARASHSTCERVAFVNSGGTFSGPLTPPDPFRQPYDSTVGWSGVPVVDKHAIERMPSEMLLADWRPPTDVATMAQDAANGAPMSEDLEAVLLASNRHVPVLSPQPVDDASATEEPTDPADLVAFRTERAKAAGASPEVIAEIVKRARNSNSPRGRTRLMNDLSRKYSPDDGQRAEMLSDLVHAVWGEDSPPFIAPMVEADQAADAPPDDAVVAFDQPAEMTDAQRASAALQHREEARTATMRPEYADDVLAGLTDLEALVRMGETARVRSERTAIIRELGRRHAWTHDYNRRLVIEHPGFPGDATYSGPVADLSGAEVVDIRTEKVEAAVAAAVSATAPDPAPAFVLHDDPALAVLQVEDLLKDADSVAAIQRAWSEAGRRGMWSEALEKVAMARMRVVER